MAKDSAAVHRPLTLVSPHARGDDVRALQRALHARGEDGVSIDGEYGPETSAACARQARRLGALESTIAKGCTVGSQRIIRDPKVRTEAQIRRAKERADQAAKDAKAHGTGGAGALAWAHKQIGIKEHPPNSNRGNPQPDGWEREAGFLGSAWCGAFAKASAKYGGGVVVTERARYVPWLEEAARSHTGGYDGWFDVRDVAAMIRGLEPGDHICYDWNRDDVDDHVGVLDHFYKDAHGVWHVVCVEGNTAVGDDSNGGEVMLRDRVVIGNVAGGASVRWS